MLRRYNSRRLAYESNSMSTHDALLVMETETSYNSICNCYLNSAVNSAWSCHFATRDTFESTNCCKLIIFKQCGLIGNCLIKLTQKHSYPDQDFTSLACCSVICFCE